MSWMSELPAIGSFLAGPAGGIVGAGVEWLAGKVGASQPTLDAIKDTLDKTPADQIQAMKKLDIEFQEFCMDNKIKLDLAQIAVNTEEAKSTNWFVAGWRPFVGWVCGFGLAYVSVIEPIARFIAKVGFNYTGAFPQIDTNLTMQVLLGMLGMGVMRTVEKHQNVESNR
jgi:hypothetical protein